MPMNCSVFSQLLQPIDRRAFAAIVARHDGDAYDKKFRSWDHVVALIFAQTRGICRLRALVSDFNANARAHYHLNSRALKRSTLSEANARRPVGVFADLFTQLSAQLDRQTRRDGADLVRLIDSTPIPLSRFLDFARSNGRVHGMKMHVVHDPAADRPMRVEITPANVNDIEIGKKTDLEAGATYVFDKGYCDYAWWRRMHAAGGFFLTRPKSNVRFSVVAARPLGGPFDICAGGLRGDGFTVTRDCEVALASKGDSKLPMRLRRITLERDALKPDGKPQIITLITNDMQRSPVEIGALYKGRWTIELLFRWIKQHLVIRKFIGKTENAVKLQLIAAMIAFTLLRIVATKHGVALSALRFVELVGALLFDRRPIDALDEPPPKYVTRKGRPSPHQLEWAWA